MVDSALLTDPSNVELIWTPDMMPRRAALQKVGWEPSRAAGSGVPHASRSATQFPRKCQNCDADVHSNTRGALVTITLPSEPGQGALGALRGAGMAAARVFVRVGSAGRRGGATEASAHQPQTRIQTSFKLQVSLQCSCRGLAGIDRELTKAPAGRPGWGMNGEVGCGRNFRTGPGCQASGMRSQVPFQPRRQCATPSRRRDGHLHLSFPNCADHCLEMADL